MRTILYLTFLIFILIGSACQTKYASDEIEVSITSDLFSDGTTKGKVDRVINEASGIDASIANENTYWTHNDSGDEARVFLMGESGQVLWVVKLKGLENRDWEDIAVGPGPEDGVNYVYVSETGDNRAVHDTVYIYRFEEPVLSMNVSKKDTTISGVEKISCTYPNGKRDAETLLLHHQTKDLYIVSKREDNVIVYKAPYPQSSSKHIVLEQLGALPFSHVVGGDISPNGDEVILKNYDNIMYWKKPEDGENIIDYMLSKPATILTYTKEPQGEAIAWKNDATGYFTISEQEDSGEKTKLLYYKRLSKK